MKDYHIKAQQMREVSERAEADFQRSVSTYIESAGCSRGHAEAMISIMMVKQKEIAAAQSVRNSVRVREICQEAETEIKRLRVLPPYEPSSADFRTTLLQASNAQLPSLSETAQTATI